MKNWLSRVHAASPVLAGCVVLTSSPLTARAVEPNLDFGISNETSYQAFIAAISKAEYVRYAYVKDPKPRVIGAAAGLVHFATRNPLATEAQLTAFINAYDAALTAHVAGDADLQRGSHLVTALRFELPLSGVPALDGADTRLGEDIVEFLGVDVPPPDGFQTNERRIVRFEQARIRELAESGAWSNLLVVGFSGQDLAGAPNAHLAGVLETYLVAEGYSPYPPPPCDPLALDPSIIGDVDTPGNAFDAAVSGDLVFVADNASGVQVIDASNPAAPVIVGSVGTPGLAQSLASSGSLVFVADESGGLQVVDASNPAAPALVGGVATTGMAMGIELSGNTAFVADGTDGLQIIDVSNPAAPTIVGHVDTPGFAIEVAVSGGLAFVADGGSGLQVIDISNLAAPFVVGSVILPDFAFEPAVSGDFVFVTASFAGLQVVDVSNPAAPFIAGAVDTPGFANRLTIDGARAFVADFESGVQVIDITNPAAPAIAASVDTPGNAYSATLSGDLLFAADDASGLQVLQISGCFDFVGAAIATLPASYSQYQALLADPFASGGIWDTVVAGFDGVTQESSDRVDELAAAMTSEPSLVQGVANAKDAAFLAEREAVYFANLDKVADKRVIINANALLLAQHPDAATQALAGRTQEFSRVQIGQNKGFAAATEGVKIVSGLATLAFSVKKDPTRAIFGATNAITGALGLGSLFGGGDSADQQILDEIVAMRNQLNDMQTQLNGRFDRIETQLNVIYTALFDGFNELGTQLGDLQMNLAAANMTLEDLERDIAQANASLERIEDALWSIGDAILETQLALITNDVLNYRSGGGDLSYTAGATNFVTGMSNLFTFATTTAINNVYAGDNPSTLTVANAAGRLGDPSIGRQINDLRVFPTQLSQSNLLNSRVPAPSLWAQSASAYAQVARESPWYFAFLYGNQLGAPGVPDLDDIIDAGQDLRALAANARDQALFDAIFDGWRAELDVVTTVVSNAVNPPSVVGSIGPGGNPFGVAISGDLAYSAAAFGGLRVVDISDPTTPVNVGSVITGGQAWDVQIDGNLAYVADTNNIGTTPALHVIDISNPAAPMILGSVITPNSPKEVAISGSLAVVADGLDVLVIDVSIPATPTIIGSVTTPGNPYGVVVVGNLAFVADGLPGLQVIDISTPAAPVIVGSVNTPGFALRVAVSGNLAYVADDSAGLRVIDISTPTAPTAIGNVATPGQASDVVVRGKRAFVTDQTNGLHVIDIFDPTSPTIDATVGSPPQGWGAAVSGDLAILSDGGTLQMIDVADDAWQDALDDLDASFPQTETNLLGYQSLMEAYITLGMPELMEESAIVRATLRADATVGELSIGPVSDIIGGYIGNVGVTDSGWPVPILDNLQLLQDEVNAAIANPSVGHGYVEYMLDDLNHLRDYAFELAVDDTFEVSASPARDTVASPGLLGNDVDQPFRIVEVDTLFALEPEYVAPLHGAVTVFADGSFQYEPDPGFSGTDSFTYRARTTVTILVDEVPTPVTVYSDPATVVINVAAPLCTPDLSGDSVVDGADLAVLLASWGAGPSPADLTGDGAVDGADLAILLASWGACN